jgi:hypothetical protein
MVGIYEMMRLGGFLIGSGWVYENNWRYLCKSS